MTQSLVQHAVDNAPPALAAFDYTALPKEVADQARETAEVFHRGRRRAHADALDVGDRLLRLKESLEHGQFTRWVSAALGIDERTAQNYMNLVRQLGSEPEIISDLPLNVAYKLAAPSVPDPARENIIAKLKEARITPDAVEQMIAEAKSDEKERRASEREEALRVQKNKIEAGIRRIFRG